MLKIINNKIALLATSLVCCMINVNSIATNRKLTRANYEQIYRLRLKWAIEDLNKDHKKLEVNLNNLREKEKQISDNIEQLKKEKLLSYHLDKTFNALYSKPQPFIGKPILWARPIWNTVERGRFLLAYGLLPITLPLATAYVTTEWLSKKNNDDKIAQLEKDQQKINAEIQEVQQTTDYEIRNIEQKITELEIESKEMKELENFIATYKPRHA